MNEESRFYQFRIHLKGSPRCFVYEPFCLSNRSHTRRLQAWRSAYVQPLAVTTPHDPWRNFVSPSATATVKAANILKSPAAGL